MAQLISGRCLVWCTELPYEDFPRESPSFVFQDSEWCLRFTREWGTGTCSRCCYYRIWLMKKNDQPKQFRTITVKTYARFEKQMTTKLPDYTYNITEPGQCIWCTERYTFETKPGIPVPELAPSLATGNFLRFIFVFEDAIRPTPGSKHKTEDKFVQTGWYLNTTTHACLESLSDDLSKLLDGGPKSDVEVTCSGRTVKAHSNILRARSEVFATMLQSDMVEGRTGRVQVRDMDADVFENFLRYLYTGTMPELTADTAKEYYAAGDKYSVRGLMRRCADFLMDNLTPEKACECLALADDHSDVDLKENAIAYILDKKVHLMEDHWLPFCERYPKLATVVLNRFCKMHTS